MTSGRRGNHLDPASSVVLSEQVDTVALATGLVLLDTHSGDEYALNDTATAIVSRMSKPQTVRQLASDLESVFGIDRETIQRDVLAFLSDLHSRKMLVVVNHETSRTD
jgi:hypothetical protein